MFDPAVYETYVVRGDGVPLDLIIWRRYRRSIPGIVEATLSINPGLAALGPRIPHGTTVRIPVDKPTSVRQVPIIRLW